MIQCQWHSAWFNFFFFFTENRIRLSYILRGGPTDAEMQEMMDQDSTDFEIPDHLLDLVTYDYLVSHLDTDVLLGDPWLNETDPSSCGEVSETTEVPSPLPNHQLGEKIKTTEEGKYERKRVSDEQLCTEDIWTAKRQRATGADTSSSPSEIFPTTPHVHSSSLPPPLAIQFITLPESPEYQNGNFVQLPPPRVIHLSLPNNAVAPTYIIVPAASPPCKRHLPPLSPVDSAVAPVQMSSSPPGSLSDSASKVVSPSCASPASLGYEIPSFKEMLLPHFPEAIEMPQIVKDYIEQAKTYMSETCQTLEAGITLTSHYVDVQVTQRQLLRSGKNTSRCPLKELIVMGDTDRQKSLLELSQIFEDLNGHKSKHVLLVGNAGMGKTTLIKKLCLDWSSDCIPKFDFVFLLDGKALGVTEPIYSLQTLLLNHSTFAPACMDPEAIYSQILSAPKQVLIIFDGFDELRDYETLLQTQEKDLITSLQKNSKAQAFTVRQLYSAVLQKILLPGCTLLLSSRPMGATCQLLRRADCFLEVCGFTPTNVESYLSKYFTDSDLKASVVDSLKSSTYLQLLCWNPGLCRLVCLVLEQSKRLDPLPRTLTGLCHQVLCLKIKKGYGNTHLLVQSHITVQCVKELDSQVSTSSQLSNCYKNNNKTKTKTQARSLRPRKAKEQEKLADISDEEMENSGGKENRAEEEELLSQLGALAWEGVKANSSVLCTGQFISDAVKDFGLRTGLLLSQHLKRRLFVSTDKKGRQNKEKQQREEVGNSQVLMWASPFLQSYMAAVHLFLSRTMLERNFLQTLPLQSGGKNRRRLQREEFELTQRFAVSIIFHSRAQLQKLHSCSEKTFTNFVFNKRTLVRNHLERLSYNDLSPAQVLELCHCIYEASFTDDKNSTGGSCLLTHLAANLPEFLTFHGVALGPPDVFIVQKALEKAATVGRRFCLDLTASGIQICGLKSLVGLSNIKTYRACIADVISLWKQLEQNSEEGLLTAAVSKLTINPLKATQVCHIEHLAKLVGIHLHRRLPDSSSESDSLLADGVPAVEELHKLEFELGPEKGPLAHSKLWELLPGLHNLQHLDLENSKIGDKGAEKLSHVLVSLCSLQVLNLSQNCIGDNGVKKLAISLKELPKLHRLSLYSNVISDEGAESLAAVLPHMTSLIDLDVKYTKLTDVGAQSLAASLKNCTKIKTLRMWNQCIPCGVFERLQQQDNRILWH